MINLSKEYISDVPVIELYKAELVNQPLPTVVFYHGWESYKERVLEQGYALARKGFLVLLPEAMDHGERKQELHTSQDPLNFWAVVAQNVRELPIIMDFYIKNNKTDPERIGVAGLSMGGITTSAILTQYDWVKAAVVLMGSPSPVEFTEWLLENYHIDDVPVYELLDRQMVKQRLKELVPISLNAQPEKINNRPVYFWHGTHDPIVPSYITEEFVENIMDKPFSTQVTLELSEGVEHRVPRKIVHKMADYFFMNL